MYKFLINFIFDNIILKEHETLKIFLNKNIDINNYGKQLLFIGFKKNYDKDMNVYDNENYNLYEMILYENDFI
jgi:hypothetical protein